MNILIFTPPNFTTGGVELLHQVCFEFNKYKSIGVNAYIQYTDISGNPIEAEHPEVYKTKYNNPIKTGNMISKDDILIFPEIFIPFTNKPEYEDNLKIIYWESVDNYVRRSKASKYSDVKNLNTTIHFAQSYYAYDFLLNTVEISKSNIYSLTDYLNDAYLEDFISITKYKQVVYNPIKGMNYTSKIIQYMPDVKFVPIRDMTVEQVRDLLRTSMVYIDFGNHPGKDRIPREAAMSGCCVIVANIGSAKFKEDVNIPEEYKFPKNKHITNIEAVCNKIRYILDNYQECSKDFDEYRSCIKKEKESFQKMIYKLISILGDPTLKISLDIN